MTRDLRDAAADLLHAASERIRRQGHHNGSGWMAALDPMTSRQWAYSTLPIAGWFALRLEAGCRYPRGENPPVVDLAIDMWGAHLNRSGEPIVLDSDGFFDAPATVAAYEQAAGRTANQIAETMRVAAALELAAHVTERKAAVTANATAQQQGSVA